MGEGSRLGTGDRIADYRIELVLNRGEQWDLVAAAHVVLPRLAAIRVAQPGQPTASVRLLREACIIEALTHPGVPRLYDCGRMADRRPWIATERVLGRVLSESIATGPLAPSTVAALIRDVAAILEHAHKRGIVHRAVRPESILLTDATERGWPVCLCDWSEARTLDAVPAPRRTGPHDAPEVARGDRYDGAIDVFALGVVAFEALAGRQFAETAALSGVGDRVARYLGDRTAISPAVGRLAWLIDDMLAVDPGRRPTAAEARASAAEIEIDLDREHADGKDLAMAMRAVEEIALVSGVEIDFDAEEDTPMAGPPPEPRTDTLDMSAHAVSPDAPEPIAPEPTTPTVMPAMPTPPAPPLPTAPTLGLALAFDAVDAELEADFDEPEPEPETSRTATPPSPIAIAKLRIARGSGQMLDEKAAVARMRKPRWTPSNITMTSDQTQQVSGEIDLTKRDPTDED